MEKNILVVFDLDFTLWNCGGMWIDCTNPPFKKLNGNVVDSENRRFFLYPDVINLLQTLQNRNIPMGLASRTGEPQWADNLLKLFSIDHFFTYKEIYPAGKSKHFKNLKNKTGIPFNHIYFFDDEYRNIDEVSSLGVNCMLVNDGVKKETVLNFIQNG